MKYDVWEREKERYMHISELEQSNLQYSYKFHIELAQ